MTDETRCPELPLTWRVHLAARQPRRAVFTAALVATTIACTYLGFHSWELCVAGGLLLTGSLGEFFFPVRYRLDERGASVTGVSGSTSIEWSCVRRCYGDPEGVKLSPLPHPSRLECWRGVYLRFQDNEQVVLELVKRLATNRDPSAVGEVTG